MDDVCREHAVFFGLRHLSHVAAPEVFDLLGTGEGGKGAAGVHLPRRRDRLLGTRPGVSAAEARRADD
jgi:hypothetical protein